MPLSYDEKWTLAALQRISPRGMATFATACASRLARAYAEYSWESGTGDVGNFETILASLWADLCGSPMSSRELSQSLASALSLIPNEDDTEWTPHREVGEDAAAALAYALRCRESGEASEAGWASRRAYEAADAYVIRTMGIDTNQPGGEEQVLQHRVVQTELARQSRDLADLADLADADVDQRVRDIHARALNETLLDT